MNVLATLALLVGPAWAEVAPDPAVYTCHVYVTGSDVRNRPAALDQCVRDVLVKLSGDPSVADDPRSLLGERAAGLVEDFVYVDLMSDIATHDEQGTRDRPFDMIGHVRPEDAAKIIRDIARTAWTSPRPSLHVEISVSRGPLRYMLTGDDQQSERQREALLAAADRFAIRVHLPVTGDRMGEWLLHPLNLIGAPTEDRIELLGLMSWSDADFGWNVSWLYRTPNGERRRWNDTGLSFDQAFRSGIGRAAQSMSKSQPTTAAPPSSTSP